MSMRFKCYTKDGYELDLDLPATGADYVAAELAKLKAAGITPKPPVAGESSDEKIADVGCVVYRRYVNDKNRDTECLDFYGRWQGEFGKFRFAVKYLNNQQDRDEFEKVSGLELRSMKVREEMGGIQRNEQRPHPHENVPLLAFSVAKVPDGTFLSDQTGKEETKYKFSRYIPGTGPAPVQARPSVDTELFAMADKCLGRPVKGNEQTFAAVLKFLGGPPLAELKEHKDAEYRQEVLNLLTAGYDAYGDKLVNLATGAKADEIPF